MTSCAFLKGIVSNVRNLNLIKIKSFIEKAKLLYHKIKEMSFKLLRLQIMFLRGWFNQNICKSTCTNDVFSKP